MEPSACSNSVKKIALYLAVTVLFAACGQIARAADAPQPLVIEKVGNTDPVGLNDNLTVILQTDKVLDPSQFSLFLNGQEMKGLADTSFNGGLHALIFHLKRDKDNERSWNSLLGAPTALQRQVFVTLGQRTDPKARPTMIEGAGNTQPAFNLVILSPERLIPALFLVGLMYFLVLSRAKSSAALKDNLLPQIRNHEQTFSLGRCQMAFWFLLVLASYVFLYIILGDPNVLSDQALELMGISGATALAAVAVDVKKDSPEDATNAALRVMGICDYSDIVRINTEIALRQAELAANPAPDAAAKIQCEINDREIVLQTYRQKVKRFTTRGWFKDITHDVNGMALHRIQVVAWTVVLGLIFIFEVWRDLSMPQFSTTLLALMGVSGAGYVGFKYPEAQQ